MNRSRHALSRPRFFGPLVLAGASALALCLPATTGSARTLDPNRTLPQISATSSVASAKTATTLAGTATAGLPAGGVLGDLFATGIDDIVAVDQSGTLWMYYNDSSGDQSMFASPRVRIGAGWTGYTLAAVGFTTLASILSIDPAGRLWYYPNNGGASVPGPGQLSFGSRYQVGTGWGGYTAVGFAGLYSSGSTVAPGLLAIDPAGNLWYYPTTATGSGLGGFGARSLVGTGWKGYTVDVADFNGDGRPDLLAVDTSGNLWFYRNTGGTGTATFGTRTKVGSQWSGWQAIDVGCLVSGCGSVTSLNAFADILGIDANGNMWYFPNTRSSGIPRFGSPIQVGTGWTGFRVN